MNKRRVFAWIGIVLLAGLYITDMILALIGSENAQFLLKVSIVCTMVIPIIIYGFSVLTRINDGKNKIVPDVPEIDCPDGTPTEKDSAGEKQDQE